MGSRSRVGGLRIDAAQQITDVLAPVPLAQPQREGVERQPENTLTALSAGRRPCWTWKGSQGLRSSFSAKVTLL